MVRDEQVLSHNITVMEVCNGGVHARIQTWHLFDRAVPASCVQHNN